MPYPRRRRPRTRTYALARPRRRSYFRGRPFFRRKKSRSIPLLPVGTSLGMTVVPALFGGGGYSGAIEVAKNGDIGGAIREFFDVLCIQTTGYKPSDGSFWGWGKPLTTWGGIGLAYVGHMAMNKIGVNRALAKVPWVGKYLAL